MSGALQAMYLTLKNNRNLLRKRNQFDANKYKTGTHFDEKLHPDTIKEIHQFREDQRKKDRRLIRLYITILIVILLLGFITVLILQMKNKA